MKAELHPPLPADFVAQVQMACKHYGKPERLGDLPLASVALRAALTENPRHPADCAGRGQALQRAIDAGLAALKPVDPHSHAGEVYLCLHAYIYKRDPYVSKAHQISNVASYLESRHHIPKATYHNWKDEGLEKLCFELSARLATRTALLEPIPVTPGFVGRVGELEYYGRALAEQRMAVIQGIGGIGKTALAAQLAQKVCPDAVCWLTLRAGLNNTFTAILHTWAAFLAQHGWPHLWAFLRAAAADLKPPDILPLLQTGLAAVQPLLCLDNLETISPADRPVWSLLEFVQQEPHTRLLLTSRTRPPLTGLGDYSILQGLAPEETGRLLRQRGLDLTPEQVQIVTQYTNGNPRLLELWTAHCRRAPAMSDINAALKQLAHSPAAEHYLATEIIAALSAGELSAAWLLALSRRPLDGFVLQHPPDELPLDEVGIAPEDFTALLKQGLIHIDPGEQWTLSPVVSDYLCRDLTGFKNLSGLSDLHQCLAQLYAMQGDTLEMAYHLAQSGNAPRAVIALAEAKHQLIERGQAYAINTILTGIQADLLDEPTRHLLHMLSSELLCLLGDYAAAEAQAHAAAQIAVTPAAQAIPERMLGTLAKLHGNIPQAIDHYQRALQLLATQQSTQEAGLRRELAWALMQQGDMDVAWLEAQKTRIALENTLGVIARRRGDFEQALTHLQTAAQVAQDIGERRELMRVNNSLGRLYEEQGRLEQAIAVYQDNLAVIEEIGELVGKAATCLNIGVCYFKLNNYAAAIENETAALHLFEQLGDRAGTALAHTNLAEAYLCAGQLAQARAHIEQAVNATSETISPGDRAEAQRVYAEVLLAHNDLDAAWQAAHTALALAWPDTTRPPAEPQLVALIQQTLVRIRSAST